MAAGEATSGSRGRKSSTPSTSSSRPSSSRPLPPKRAHTSAASTASLRTITKNAAAAAAANASSVNKAKSPLAGSPVIARNSHHSSSSSSSPPPSLAKSSPNYFTLKLDDESNHPESDAGRHAKRNWASASSVADSEDVPVEDDLKYEPFRRQSEQSNHFKLGNSTLNRFSTDGRVPTLRSLAGAGGQETRGSGTGERRPALSAGGRVQAYAIVESQNDAMDVDANQPENTVSGHASSSHQYFNIPRYDSPQAASGSSQPPDTAHIARSGISTLSESSLPHSRVTTPHSMNGQARADTLPSKADHDCPKMLSPPELCSLLEDSSETDSILLLDLRVSPQYAQARVKGALNLCIPTTLLKRPAFNVQKLQDTFNNPVCKEKFGRWKHASTIIVYDASSIQLKDAQSGVNTVKKFRNEGYKGECFILKGGFNAISNAHPEVVERPASGAGNAGGLRLPLGTSTLDGPPNGMHVAGGCPMPETGNQPANPFFGNIRQNMDLLDGVGQMPVKRPAQLNGANVRGLPQWLRDVVDEEDEGKLASERFLEIERTEQRVMQKAYSTRVQYDASSHAEMESQAKKGNVQIAGIEKGSKNRYKDMLPYEHTRVRLEHTDSEDCDYINASHVKAKWCNRRYIATQAPIPNTFKDVRVIVMLTAESENGQRKCHPYWKPDTYGHYKIKHLGEKRLSLERPSRASLLEPNRKVSMPLSALPNNKDSYARMQRRATLMGEGDINAGASAQNSSPAAPPEEPPFCIVRKLALSDVQQPFVPLRDVVQVEYTSWPDFGAPAESGEVLTLVEQVDNVIRLSNGLGNSRRDAKVGSLKLPNGLGRLEDDESKWPASPRERPVVVHCSAGCGRTGTFVTVDSVVDMLKRQRMVASRRRDSSKAQPGLKIKVPAGAGSGGKAEPNPFEAAASVMSPSNLDTIVSPTSRMEIDSPKKRNSDRNLHNNIRKAAAVPQQAAPQEHQSDEISQESDDESDDEDEDNLDGQEWVGRDDIDLVQKAVQDFRLQRLSMVQNLRQYTLCYESIMEWLVREMPERFRRDQFRKSYQG